MSVLSSMDHETIHDDTDSERVVVCVRVRPLLQLENDIAWSWLDNTISCATSYSTNRKSSIIGTSGRKDEVPTGQFSSYSFDYVFKPEQSNEFIFNSVVEKAAYQSMLGFNSSIFAYGQSGSGKTFTMLGTSRHPGIIPYTINYCFNVIQQFSNREFLFQVSYLEVYNEQIKDLLNSEPSQIKIQDGGLKIGVSITGVKEQVVLNPDQVMGLMRAGEAQRHVGSTGMNDKSSRAHTLFKLTIESKERNENASVRVSTLSLVDLAGSENAKMTNSSGARAQEAKFINQSLLTLSTIIQRLSEEKEIARKQHLPYRDSKLTRLMQSSLSGNSNIIMICTISPTTKCVEESNNTLKFASRAKKIRTEAHINESLDDKTLLKVYRQEIEELKAKLQSLESQSNFGNANSIGNGLGVLEDVDVDVDENKTFIIQMISEMERLILKADPILDMNNIAVAPNHRSEPNRPVNSKVSLRSSGSVDTESSSSKSLSSTPTSYCATNPKPSGIKPPSTTRSGTKSKPNSVFQSNDTKSEFGRLSDTIVESKSQENTVIETQKLNDCTEDSNYESPARMRSKISKMLVILKDAFVNGSSRVSSAATVDVVSDSIDAPSMFLPSSMKPNSISMENLFAELRLKEADNNFLQQELQSKNQMLVMLTDGLREVEINQEKWLKENEILSLELEQSLRENNYLRDRISKLEKDLCNGGIVPITDVNQHQEQHEEY